MADETETKDTVSTATAATTASAVYRPVIRHTDMPAEMQRDAVECAGRAFALYDNPSDVAAYVANRFDEKYGSAWQAIVGRNFRCYVEHDQGSFAYFYFGHTAVVMFKSGEIQN